jgi:outer membrane protein assembly factor BamE
MKTKHIIFSAAIALSLTACGGASNIGKYETGQYVTPEQMASFVDKKTKKNEVIAAIGHPNRKAEVNKREVWYYDYNMIKSFGKGVNESAVFEFEKDILVQHYKTGGQPDTSNPLLKKAAEK